MFIYLFIPFLGTEIPEPGPLRLVGGPNRCAGRVEVLHEEQWGSVCHDEWDINDAQVVCKQLGCGDAVLAPIAAKFGRGTDTIWLDDVNCTGSEASLSECQARPWGDHNCYHGEDASAICSGNLFILLFLLAVCWDVLHMSVGTTLDRNKGLLQSTPHLLVLLVWGPCTIEEGFNLVGRLLTVVLSGHFSPAQARGEGHP